MYDWHKIGKVSSLPENKLTEISVADKRIGLLKRQDNIFAFSALCPHASGELCEGWLDALGNIVCPVHQYRFNPKNGYNASGEGYKLKTYPVEIKGDEIFIGILS